MRMISTVHTSLTKLSSTYRVLSNLVCCLSRLAQIRALARGSCFVCFPNPTGPSRIMSSRRLRAHILLSLNFLQSRRVVCTKQVLIKYLHWNHWLLQFFERRLKLDCPQDWHPRRRTFVSPVPQCAPVSPSTHSSGIRSKCFLLVNINIKKTPVKTF